MGVVNNPSSTKLSYSKWKNPVLNPLKSFLDLKNVNTRILSSFKRSFSKKMGKTPSSHIINLILRVLSYPPYGVRERETLENAGHVAPEQN